MQKNNNSKKKRVIIRLGSMKEAQETFEEILLCLNDRKLAVADFSKVDAAPTCLLNIAFGQLYYIYNPDFIKAHIEVRNIGEYEKQNLKKVCDNAKKSFNNKITPSAFQK